MKALLEESKGGFRGAELPDYLVWTSGDKEVALNMVFMYTLNSKKREWWKEVGFIVWGPSAKLLAEDQDLQDYLLRIKDAGVSIEACKTCADNYGVAKKLEDLGIEVRLMGMPLTNYIKEGYPIITF